jgi:hypothetical protein
MRRNDLSCSKTADWCTWQWMKSGHRWFEWKSKCKDSRKHCLAGNSLSTDQERKNVVQGWLKGLLSRHFIFTLYSICFKIAFYIVLNFVIFSCSGNRTGFILIGQPVVSVFLNGPIMLRDTLFKSLHIHNLDTRWKRVCNTHYFQHLKHYQYMDHTIRHAHQEYSVISANTLKQWFASH